MADEPGFVIRLALAAFATWRLTHLLAKEDGPWDLVVRLRGLFGNSSLGKLMDCFNCLSLWIAAPMAFFVSGRPSVLALTWLALSGVAILLEGLRSEPLTIEHAPGSTFGEASDGVLWSEKIDAERRPSPASSADN